MKHTYLRCNVDSDRHHGNQERRRHCVPDFAFWRRQRRGEDLLLQMDRALSYRSEGPTHTRPRGNIHPSTVPRTHFPATLSCRPLDRTITLVATTSPVSVHGGQCRAVQGRRMCARHCVCRQRSALLRSSCMLSTCCIRKLRPMPTARNTLVTHRTHRPSRYVAPLTPQAS